MRSISDRSVRPVADQPEEAGAKTAGGMETPPHPSRGVSEKLSLKISVAMCTYNGALFLQEQLASLSGQTRPPDELVVCDDGSSDATVEIVNAFAAGAAFPVCLYVNEKNLGVAKNFERAIELCGGEIIACADQDDVWRPEKLQLIEREFSSAPEVGLVFSDAEIVNAQLEPTGHTIWEYSFTEKHRRKFRAGRAFEILLGGSTVTGATMAFRSSYRKLILPIPPEAQMIHDGWIALVVATAAEFVYIDQPLIKYRQHERQQLGVLIPEPFNLRKVMHAARRTHAESYQQSLKKFKAVHERLAAHREELRRPEWVLLLEEWIKHLDSRARLPPGKLRRLPHVFHELLTLRYHRYSKGLSSAFKDVWF